MLFLRSVYISTSFPEYMSYWDPATDTSFTSTRAHFQPRRETPLKSALDRPPRQGDSGTEFYKGDIPFPSLSSPLSFPALDCLKVRPEHYSATFQSTEGSARHHHGRALDCTRQKRGAAHSPLPHARGHSCISPRRPSPPSAHKFPRSPAAPTWPFCFLSFSLF